MTVVERTRNLLPALPFRHHVGVHTDVYPFVLQHLSGQPGSKLLLRPTTRNASLPQVATPRAYPVVHSDLPRLIATAGSR